MFSFIRSQCLPHVACWSRPQQNLKCRSEEPATGVRPKTNTQGYLVNNCQPCCGTSNVPPKACSRTDINLAAQLQPRLFPQLYAFNHARSIFVSGASRTSQSLPRVIFHPLCSAWLETTSASQLSLFWRPRVDDVTLLKLLTTYTLNASSTEYQYASTSGLSLYDAEI